MGRPRRRIGNIPAETTSFVGRRHELAEARRLLSTARLVSLVGPGGVGKTRLAVRLADDLSRGFAQGGWWVSLAELRDPDRVAAAVLTALEVPEPESTEPQQRVLDHLRETKLLLVLDNCEHVVASAAALVDQVLRAAPDVRVIVTSREPLQVQGEHLLPVPPLALPPPGGGPSPAQLAQNEAVLLFSERALAASGTFVLTDANQAAVAELCRRLDGLPLALELAAVRARVLTVEQILDRLSDRFALLTGGGRAALPRQQTLRTAIDWSHDLLTAGEQRLLRRLCRFAGPFTLDDLEGVCLWDEDGKGLELLSSLVDKSLVTRQDVGGVACFRLHETMREYAAGKLRDADEGARVDHRFVEHYRTRCVDTADDAWHRPLDWLAWVERELDNLRLALHLCVAAADWSRGLDIVAALGPYWSTRGTRECRQWLDSLLAAAGESTVPATVYRLRGWCEMRRAHGEAARPWLARAVSVARRSDDRVRLTQALATASIAENMAGNQTVGRRFLDEAETIAAAGAQYPVPVEVVQAQAVHAFFAGELAAADELSVMGERLCREAGDLYYLIQMLLYQGQAAILRGDAGRAEARLVEALRVARQLDDRPAQYDVLTLLAWPVSASGRFRLTAQLLGAAGVVQAGAGAGLTGPYEPLLQQARQRAVDALGADGFEAAYGAGQRMDRADALRLAMGEAHPSEAAEPNWTGPLAPREVEVARLVGDGLTNKQIATRLFISDRTVATHVRNIMDKLGFATRAQIASWVSSPAS